MRISDWSSDLCSSDLSAVLLHGSGRGSARIGRSSHHNSAAATTANAASSRKKAGWPTFDQSIPTTPASRLPLKIARNHDATVVAPRRGGASFANSPRPVGRIDRKSDGEGKRWAGRVGSGGRRIIKKKKN